MKDSPVESAGLESAPLALLKREEPTRALLSSIADKWVVLILLTLEEDGKRYSEILSTVEGISQKVLSQRLAMLASHGLVSRTSHPETPPRVVYALTDLGRTAVPAARHIASWVLEYKNLTESVTK